MDGADVTQRAGQGVGHHFLIQHFPAVFRHSTQSQVMDTAKRAVSWWQQQDFNATLACYGFDEPHNAQDVSIAVQRAGWVHSAVGNQLPFYLTIGNPRLTVPTSTADLWGELPAAKAPGIQQGGGKIWSTN